jgi:hypothetical protein
MNRGGIPPAALGHGNHFDHLDHHRLRLVAPDLLVALRHSFCAALEMVSSR